MRSNCDCADCYARGIRYETVRINYFQRLGDFYAPVIADAESRLQHYMNKLSEMDIGLTAD